MKHDYRVRRGAVAAAVCAVTSLAAPFDPQPVGAQYEKSYCRVDLRIENRIRRVTGEVNTECGDDRHDAPLGNWGAESPWGSRENRDQFMGWAPVGSTLQWNSCTSLYDLFNDGPWEAEVR